MSVNYNSDTQMYYIRKSDGLAYCFSPVPFLSDSKQRLSKIKDGTQTAFGINHTVTLNGTLLPCKPALSGVDPNASVLQLLDMKSDQLCNALSEDLGNLLIVDASGYAAMSIYPKITSIDFPESQIVQKRDYTITLEYSEALSDTCKINDFNESWDFSFQDDDTISASHSLDAVGIPELPAGTGAMQNAKNFVLSRANALDRTQYSFLTSPYMSPLADADILNEYNHVRSESINESDGSYSITETWIMASGAFKDDRTIDRSFELDELGGLVETLSVNGTVVGYGDTTIDRYNGAVLGFEGTVAPEIGFLAANGISSKNRSDNRFGGSVTYSLTYETETSTPVENRSISRSLQRNEDGTVTQSVTTSAAVKLSSASDIEDAVAFCFANNFPLDSLVEPYFSSSLLNNIESVSSQRDELAKSFSLTRVYRDQGASLYREEYNVSRDINAETATTSVSINGTVQGLSPESSTSSIDRFIAASGAFYGTIQSLIPGRAAEIIPAGSCIGSSPIQQTLGFNKFNGIITYSQRFDNRFVTSNVLIRDEKIDVSYNLASDVIAVIPIPGKSTGPILQDQETTTGLQKSLRITYSMVGGANDCGSIDTVNQGILELEALSESNILVNNTPIENSRGEKPIATSVFRTADQYTFNRQTLVFTRSVTWQYSSI